MSSNKQLPGVLDGSETLTSVRWLGKMAPYWMYMAKKSDGLYSGC